MAHLLSCECGIKHPITTGQAGEMITCDCGTKLEVPTFREIRNLPLAEEVGKKQKKLSAGSWNPAKGGLFVGGVIMAILGWSIGGFLMWAKPEVDYDEIERFETFITESLDNMGPDEAIDVWEQIKQDGLGEQQPPDYVSMKIYAERMVLGANIAMVLGGLGIAMCLASLIIPAKSS